jgi:serine/threonine-protein kinase
MGPDSQIALSATQRATEPSAATEDARLEAGVRAGDYVVERFLGAGAMGEVYAGKHPEIGKRVAIKVLKLSLATSAEAAERFKREARVVNQIDHANVIDVFAFGRLEDGRLYLVMDLVDGETLRAAVANGPMDIATALDVLEQIADALDAAHAKGVVHRDLKPDNVMIANGKVFVLDFGIAKLLTSGDTNPGSLLTGKGAWIGTPGYMAPEQWAADGAGPASDRYALGVMAFELLSGKLPFQAPTLPQMMEQHFRAPVPALSTRGAVAARSMFDPVLARAMAKDPTKRYATAKELVVALRDASGTKYRRAVGPPRRLWMPAAIGAGVLGVAVVAVIFARHGTERGNAPSPASSSGFVQLEVRSNPSRATVLRGDRMYGTTPAKLEVRDGEQVDLTIKKPGYAPERKALAASEDTRAVDVVLRQVNGFEGTWVLPDGQLRAFTRSGDDHVDVFKLASLKGEKEFYRKFLFEDSPAGVKFASTDTVVDQRAPSEPSCQVPVRVEYLYDPQRDVLEVRPEGIETGFQNGRCVVHNRELVAAISLVRADASTETRVTHAPMTGPLDVPSLKQMPSEEDKKQQLKEDEVLKKKNLAKPVKGTRDPKAFEPPAPTKGGKKQPPIQPNVQSKDAANVPDVPPNAPPQQQQAPDVRGDSQIAPQVKK